MKNFAPVLSSTAITTSPNSIYEILQDTNTRIKLNNELWNKAYKISDIRVIKKTLMQWKGVLYDLPYDGVIHFKSTNKLETQVKIALFFDEDPLVVEQVFLHLFGLNPETILKKFLKRLKGLAEAENALATLPPIKRVNLRL